MTEVTILGRAFNVYEVLRLITIVGAYLLFRPYLLKMTSKFQERDHARPLSSTEEDSPAAGNVAKGALPGDSEESDGEEMSWGAKVRRRKRAEREALKKAIQKEEETRACEESDEEIAEFLERED